MDVRFGAADVYIYFGKDAANAAHMEQGAISTAQAFGVSRDAAHETVRRKGNVMYYSNYGPLTDLARRPSPDLALAANKGHPSYFPQSATRRVGDPS